MRMVTLLTVVAVVQLAAVAVAVVAQRSPIGRTVADAPEHGAEPEQVAEPEHVAADPFSLLITDKRPIDQVDDWLHDDALAGRSVLVVGDSLLDDAEAKLRARLAAAGVPDPTIVAKRGSTIGWAADQVAAHPGHDVVVVAAGTNNVLDGWAHRDVRETNRALRTMRSASCPVWVAPTAWRHPVQEGRRQSLVDVDALVSVLVLHNLLAETTVHVGDWDEVAAERADLHHADGLHHQRSGRATYARFIAATASVHCADTD